MKIECWCKYLQLFANYFSLIINGKLFLFIYKCKLRIAFNGILKAKSFHLFLYIYFNFETIFHFLPNRKFLSNFNTHFNNNASSCFNKVYSFIVGVTSIFSNVIFISIFKFCKNFTRIYSSCKRLHMESFSFSKS